MQNWLFPEIEKDKKKREEEARRDDLSSLPFFSSPKNDNEILLNLQRRYLLFNDRRAWGEMWTRCLSIAGKLITIERKAKGLHFSAEELYDRRMDAVTYVLRRYSKKMKGGHVYHIRKSFLNALRGGVFHALYYEAQDKPKVKVLYAGDLFDVLKLKE